MSTIVVWSKPACQQCTAVKRWLKKREVEFIEMNLPDFPEDLEYFKNQGLMQAPIVEIDGMDAFSGFDTDKLEEAEANGLLR